MDCQMQYLKSLLGKYYFLIKTMCIFGYSILNLNVSNFRTNYHMLVYYCSNLAHSFKIIKKIICITKTKYFLNNLFFKTRHTYGITKIYIVIIERRIISNKICK